MVDSVAFAQACLGFIIIMLEFFPFVSFLLIVVSRSFFQEGADSV